MRCCYCIPWVPPPPPPPPPPSRIRKGSFSTEDFKILMLGTSGCGKTTIKNQLRIAYDDSFDESERECFKEDIKCEILEDIQTLINYAQSNNKNLSPKIEEDIEAINDCECDSGDDLTEDIARCISIVWADPVIKQIYQQANSIGIKENADYFFDNVENFANDYYNVTDLDILKAHIPTIGIHILKLIVGTYSRTKIIDLGMNDKYKYWTNYETYKNVTFVMFVISLSDFDQVMLEDKDTTRTEESINFFTDIASSPQFKNVPIFLILNKYDIFTKKLKKYPEAFRKAYPGFEGDINSESECIEYIKKEYMEHLPERESDAWIEFITTCAMDQESVKELFQHIADKIEIISELQ